jgi:hypothetical protein
LSHRLRTTTREALCIPWEPPNVSQRGDGVVEGTYESEMWLKWLAYVHEVYARNRFAACREVHVFTVFLCQYITNRARM